MVALCSATLAPCSPFLLQQQEQWCWDARAWLGWMVKAGSSPQQRGSHCPCPDSPWAASAWQSPAASPGLGSACVLGTPERCLSPQFTSTLDSLPCSSFWARVGLWRQEVPVGPCSEEGTVEPLPGPAVSPCTL